MQRVTGTHPSAASGLRARRGPTQAHPAERRRSTPVVTSPAAEAGPPSYITQEVVGRWRPGERVRFARESLRYGVLTQRIGQIVDE
jgi:hypothetical protein